jgi:DNA modification methylase
MYPLNFPLGFLKRHGKQGDWVVDPFCGRGTTNFAARLLGMPSVGVDSSPVAVALAKAKLAVAGSALVVECARAILNTADEPASIPSGQFWSFAYHEHTLLQLCQLRKALLTDSSSSERILLRAIILGALHGPRTKVTQSHFSNQSFRTFAPKPDYAVKFWTERNMLPEEVDVLSIIKIRAERYLSDVLPVVQSKVRLGDSRIIDTFNDMPKARFIITSPPYYGMRTYLQDQWLRLWFLGGSDYVDYRQTESQLEHTGADRFADDLRLVWKNVASFVTSDACLLVRYGGIHSRHVEPMEVLKMSLSGTRWRIVTVRASPNSDRGRRQVRQFQIEPKKAVTEYDVYCHLV